MSKFLIAIFTLCVFAAVSAWIMGGETGKYSTSISIDASPADVFPYLTDSEKIAQWADVVRVDSYNEDEAVSRSRVVLDEKAEEIVWEDSLLRYQIGDRFEDHAISIRSVNGGNINTYFFLLKKNDLAGTNLEYRVTRSATGLDRFLFPFRKDTTKSTITSEITKLKSLVESEVEPVDSSEIPDELGQPEDSETDVLVGAASSENSAAATSLPAAESKQPELSPVDKPEGDGGVFKSAPETPRKETEKRDFKSLFGTGGN